MSNLLNEASGLTTVQAGNGVDVKGAYVLLIASTVRLSRWITIYYVPVESAGLTAMLDIATGLAASEVDEICNIGQSQTISAPISNVGSFYGHISIPWEFAAGLRLSARIADSAAVGIFANYHMKIRLFEQPIP